MQLDVFRCYVCARKREHMANPGFSDRNITMKITRSWAMASFLLSAGSLLLATVSIVLGQEVNYLDYLSLFNAMAAGMLSLSAAALLVGLVGTWKARGRSVLLWSADAVALMVAALYVFNP